MLFGRKTKYSNSSVSVNSIFTMLNSSNESKDSNEKVHGVFLEDGINTVRKNSASSNIIENFSFTQSNFLKLLEDNMKLRLSVKEVNNNLGEEVNYLKHTLLKLQKEHEENTELLKLQARTHREDWQLEKKEKYVAQSQVQVLKKQLHLLAAKFAEHEVQNSTCLYNNGSSHPATMVSRSNDFFPVNLTEKKQRKIKSLNNMVQKNSKCSYHGSSSGTDESLSPTRSLFCTTKSARPNLDPSITKENIKEHSHKRNQNRQASKETQAKTTEKDNLIVSNSIKEKSGTTPTTSKYNGEKCKKEIPTYFSNCTDSTGTKPKLTSKSSLCKDKHNTIDAKKRARTILASALQVSPCSSGPPSPIQSLNRRHSSYVPITSTVLTPVSYKISSVGDESFENTIHQHDDIPKEISQEKTSSLINSHDASPIRKNSKCLNKFNKLDNTMNGNGENAVIEGIHTSDKSSTDTVCSNDLDVDSKVCTENFSNPKVSPSDSGVSCTSVTVQSGSHKTSQAASSNSSRSSSPGISLMTFALNSDGKGIPGAFYFELGTDSSKTLYQKSLTACGTPKPNSYVTTFNSDISSKKETVSDSNPIKENYHSEKIINATWLKLMDKKNKSMNSPTTWRTARTVSSNELFTNKQTTKDNLDNGISDKKNIDGSIGNIKVEKCQKNHRIPMDQYYFTIKDLYINSSNSLNECTDAKNTSKSPVHSPRKENHEGSDSQADLKSLASRNISCAILSYESASKCTLSQNKITKQS